ncbi:VOC family protein [Sandaracinobacteroides saxicola]|uniref:VOC family protein n=1 Tax=Sandaracinobacteroides saxicola TaxID=2759707 RepID=A0A7G5IIA3_9SPHN|nr:VOC family protein [Sandaracinobacteroides saxicola]QMW23095.1 VOC family protein [Sandaracinobacteroides saxicola]
MPLPDRLYQVAFMVDDLETACHRWVATAGAGPFFVMDPMAFIDPAPADPGIAIALGYSGDLFIELIAVRGPGPSIFHGHAANGLHHVARLSADVDATLAGLATAGHPTVFTGAFAPATRMGFADTRAALGCYTEVIEANADIDGALAFIRAAHDGWDGRDPVRTFG